MCVRRDVFNYLFSNCGVNVSRRPGKFYNRSDFCDDFFLDDDFVYCNKFGESVRVVFPVYMYSHVKFVKLSNDRLCFCEIVSVNLIKERF